MDSIPRESPTPLKRRRSDSEYARELDEELNRSNGESKDVTPHQHRARSDSDFARELQQVWNSEEEKAVTSPPMSTRQHRSDRWMCTM